MSKLDDKGRVDPSLKMVMKGRQDDDPVNHPSHYTTHPTGVECISIVEHAQHYNVGTAIAYLWRVTFGVKDDPIQDLKKAKWYIDRELAKRAGKPTPVLKPDWMLPR